jgi:hypothetical protein|tara:strand:+ start:349 stop:567 length:219 start_codon:yes stop_codon:yes gene_type:complete
MISKVKFLEKTSKSVFVYHFSNGDLKLSSDKDYDVNKMTEFFLKNPQKDVIKIDFIKSIGNHATIIDTLDFI